MLSKKDAINTFLLVVAYGLLFHVAQFFFFKVDMIKVLADGDMLATWDAGFYKQIVEKGYEYREGIASNTAFFILFPFIWKVLHLGAWGASVLNILFFAAGVTVLTRIYRLTMAEKFLWLTIPSFYFCFIPYTEALFFLLSSVVLYAMARKQKYLLWAGLFLVSLTRPVTMTFIPAFIITEVITNDRKHFFRSIGNFLVMYSWPLLIGLAFFIWYQHYETGVWFAFFKQEENWGHVFAWPTLPFHNMYGPRLLWIDALAMFVGFICMLLLFKKGFLWLFKNKVQEEKTLVFSFLYLTAMLFITMLFNPVWGNWHTNVYDIHRYAFVTPFFWVFLHRFTQNITYKWPDFVLVILLSNVFWLLFESYVHIQFTLYFNFNTVLIVFYMLYANNKQSWPPLAIAVLNFMIQVSMFQFFLQGHYPG